MSLIALALAAPLYAGTGVPAVSGALQSDFTDTVLTGMPPALTLWAPEHEVAFYVECTAGDEILRFETGAVPKGERRLFLLRFEQERRAADCVVSARMANGLAENKPLALTWKVEDPVEEPKADGKPAAKEPAADPPAAAESTVIEVPPKAPPAPR